MVTKLKNSLLKKKQKQKTPQLSMFFHQVRKKMYFF